MSQFNLPDVGEGLQEAEVVRWHVKAGDQVAVDQILLEIETDKAVVEIPSPVNGVVKTLHGNPGDIIKVGSPLVTFSEVGELETVTVSEATEETAEETTEKTTEEDSGTVVGKIESNAVVLNESPTGVQISKSSRQSPHASPAVRSLATKLGVDLEILEGSGPRGSITKTDVEQAFQLQKEITPLAKTEAPAVESQSQNKREIPPDFEPLKRARRSMARNMSDSHSQVALVTLMEDADISHWKEKEDLTVRLIAAIASACVIEPGMNVHYNHENYSIKRFEEVNLGLAVDSSDGLYVPVVKDARRKSPEEVRDLIEEFKKKANEKSFQPEDLKGATIILSNFGSIGGRYATPMVVPPTVAIVGVGRFHRELALVVNKPVSRIKLPISLSFDHRAATGGEASRFLMAMINHLQG